MNRPPGAHSVTVETADWRGVVHLCESEPGRGDWSVVGVEVAEVNGSALNAAKLRAAPWGELLELARREITTASRPVGFARPSETFLLAFAADRRGKKARTERDYAGLAYAYVHMVAEGERHKAASRWAEQYPGRSAQRWRMDIRRAKTRYVEVSDDGTLMLTEEGWGLVFGEDFFASLASEIDFETGIERTEAMIERLQNLGDGSAASAEINGLLGRYARRLTKEHGVKISREVVRRAWLAQERQKLVGVNAPPT